MYHVKQEYTPPNIMYVRTFIKTLNKGN